MTRLLTRDCWKRLKDMAMKCRGPAYVAVAFFARNAAKLLPLEEGSQLVVDASEKTVRAGLTHPNDLKQLLEVGVRIYSVANLHAKVFVFGRRAFVGSTNVSKWSEEVLIEAMIETGDRKAVVAARNFVRSCCLNELGPEELSRLQKLYHAPKFSQGKRAGKKARTNIELPRQLIAHMTDEAEPAGSEQVRKAGEIAAHKKLCDSKLFKVDWFWTRSPSCYRDSDTITQVAKEKKGHSMVWPPAKVIHTADWQKCVFVYLELPRRRCMNLARVARRIGRGGKKRLSRSGVVSREFAESLLEVWNT